MLLRGRSVVMVACTRRKLANVHMKTALLLVWEFFSEPLAEVFNKLFEGVFLVKVFVGNGPDFEQNGLRPAARREKQVRSCGTGFRLGRHCAELREGHEDR
jgi:hypothetical protein